MGVRTKYVCVAFFIIYHLYFSDSFIKTASANPILGRKVRNHPFGIHQNRDGGISGSFALGQSSGFPGSFGQSFNIGPKGFSSSGSQSSSLHGFSQGGSYSSSFGPRGSSFGNSNSGSITNPFFQSSFANANAFSQNNNFPSVFGPGK